MVKVNEAGTETSYETQSDTRLYAGLVSVSFVLSRSVAKFVELAMAMNQYRSQRLMQGRYLLGFPLIFSIFSLVVLLFMITLATALHLGYLQVESTEFGEE